MEGILYQRLGGASGIVNIVEDVMAAHLDNPVVNTRFKNIQDIDHAKKMAVEFFAACTGSD